MKILKPHIDKAEINWKYICLTHIFHHLSRLKNEEAKEMPNQDFIKILENTI